MRVKFDPAYVTLLTVKLPRRETPTIRMRFGPELTVCAQLKLEVDPELPLVRSTAMVHEGSGVGVGALVGVAVGGAVTVTSSPVLLAGLYVDVSVVVETVRAGSKNVAVAGFWYVPGGVAAPTFTVNVIATDPPPGIRKVPQLGVPLPTIGLVRTEFPVKLTRPVEAYVKPEGRTSEISTPEAPPAPAELLTVIVYVAVVPATTFSVEVVFVVVNETGTQFAPEMAAGISAGVTLVTSVPAPPGVAPKGSLPVVLMPFAPPATLDAPATAPEVKTKPPPPPPPGP
jgi:hypothetical protein